MPAAKAKDKPKRASVSVSPAARRRVIADYEAMNNAIFRDDVTIACRHITGHYTSELIVSWGGRFDSCAELVHVSKSFNQAYPEVRNNKISQVKISGDQANLIDKTPRNGKVYTGRVYLIHNGGIWKVDRVRLLSPRTHASG